MRAQKLAHLRFASAWQAALIVCLLAPASARAETASCYGNEHHQVRTATGVHYDPWRITAAHRSLPFGTRVLVTDRRTGRAVVVTINDRGPSVKGRAIDLSLGACAAIGNRGLARVSLQVIEWGVGRHAPHRNRRPRARRRP